MKSAQGRSPPLSLEIDEIPNPNIKSFCDSVQKVDADVGGAFFDSPKIGLVGANHQGESSLRNPLARAQFTDMFSKHDSVVIAFHASRIEAKSSEATYYNKSRTYDIL